jgi:hypothetical protein
VQLRHTVTEHLRLFPELWWALKSYLDVFILDGFVSSL